MTSKTYEGKNHGGYLLNVSEKNFVRSLADSGSNITIEL